MPEITKDLKGKEVPMGELPGVGAKFQLNGNTFRINYTKPSVDGFRFSADLVKIYGKNNE